jgi:hypothetical protein
MSRTSEGTVCEHGGLARQCRVCELTAELAAARAENEMMLREYGPELRECRALLWAAYTAMASVAPEVTFHPDLMASIKTAAGRGEGER